MAETAAEGIGARGRPSVLVTGASGALGSELCRAYLRMDWVVFPVVHRPEAARSFTLRGAACHPVVADLGCDGAVDAIRERVSARTSTLDVLINNAGIPGEATRLEALPPAEIRALVEIHCVGAARCTQAVLPLLRAQQRSKVVNVSSRVGSFARNQAGEFAAEALSYSYRIAKAAQNMLTICMSQELEAAGIVVSAVHPGEFASGLNPDGGEEAATAARRIVDWIRGLDGAAAGRWHDPRFGVIPW